MSLCLQARREWTGDAGLIAGVSDCCGRRIKATRHEYGLGWYASTGGVLLRAVRVMVVVVAIGGDEGYKGEWSDEGLRK